MESTRGEEHLSGYRAWRTAARIHTLPAAVTPVFVGAGLAAHDGVFRWDSMIWALLGALAIQVAANFANDVSDARRGADTEDRLGPPRMVTSGAITPRAMWMATGAAVAVSAIAGIALTVIAGPLILVIGVVSVIAMLGYVGGPIPYGYRGLGELFVFLFFGLVATVGSRYVHDSTAPLDAWLLGIPIGMLAAAILVANNYRDLDTDARANKRTLAVIIGPQRTRFLFAVLTYGAFPVIVVFAMAGWTPIATLFAAMWVPLATGPVSIVQAKTDGPALIRALKLTARLHLLTGLSLAAGAAITI
ncbi:MAG: 1,4-dihydroxy-2-naphthoate polyprenyltransferase [Actinobacteria bacterium]|nr:MAG: 1,4-dihydroxy-2-naphthoate polyprenyltransferase [Actinomycetota bacterium]